MLVTNALLRHTSLIMFLVFFTLETLLFISVLFAFKFELPGSNETIIQSGKTQNIEIINSFSSILNSTINSITFDLLLMYQNIQLIPKISFLTESNECVVTTPISDTNGIDEIKNYFNNKNLFDNKNNRIIINHQETFIQNELIDNNDLLFNKIYKYNYGQINNDVDNDDKKICCLLNGFKSLLYKNIISGQNSLIFNQMYLTFDTHAYFYPPVHDTNVISSILNNNEMICNNHENCFIIDNNDDKELQYVHILNEYMSLLSCLHIKNTLDLFSTNINHFCLINNLQSVFNFTSNSFSNEDNHHNFNIALTDQNFNLLSSLYKSVSYNKDNSIDQCKNNSSLFNFFYSDIITKLNYSQSDIKLLETECMSIYKQLLTLGNQPSYVFDFVTTISHLDSNSNSTSSTTKLKQDACIISIKPINLEHISINNNGIINATGGNNATHYIIAIMKMNIDSKFKDLFYTFFFRLFTMWSFFTILLIICCALFSVIFTKYLDSIFSPVSVIIKHFRLKLFNQTEKPLEENEEVSITKCNSSISQLNSKTPEIIDLIETSQFLVNILDMKKLLQSKIEVSDININLMNCMFSELRHNEEKIQYGFFLSSFYYQTENYNDCWKSIKNIKTHLQYEKEIVINEKENVEIELLNHLSNYSYLNDFFPSTKIFNISNQNIHQYYYELLIKSEKIYFMYAICFMHKSKQLKRINKQLQSSRSFPITEQQPSPSNKRSGNDHRINSFLFNASLNKLNRIEFEIQYNKQEISVYYEKAIKYFTKSNEINKKYSINKIKSIIILIYICKCYIYLDRKIEAIETIKKCIETFYYLNTNLIELNNKLKLNARIMLLVNATIIEQILYLIGLISKDDKNNLSASLFSQVLSISHFKTDYIQSKTAKYLNHIIKTNNINIPIYLPLNKISIRLNKKSTNSKLYRKNLFIYFSVEFVKLLPTKIELCEIISKCVKKYLNENDNVFCARFDNYREPSIKKVSEFSKEYLMKLINENFRENISKYGMQEAISFTTSTIIPNILKENILIKKEEKKITKKEYIIDSNGVINDNYIFQFILTTDYIFSSHDQNKTFKCNLNDKCVSLYTFLFDIDKLETKESLKETIPINKIKKDKRGKIIHHLRQINEGVLLLIDNFNTIKSAFQNISRDYPKKNVFNVDCELCKNIYLDYHV